MYIRHRIHAHRQPANSWLCWAACIAMILDQRNVYAETVVQFTRSRGVRLNGNNALGETQFQAVANVFRFRLYHPGTFFRLNAAVVLEVLRRGPAMIAYKHAIYIYDVNGVGRQPGHFEVIFGIDGTESDPQVLLLNPWTGSHHRVRLNDLQPLICAIFYKGRGSNFHLPQHRT